MFRTLTSYSKVKAREMLRVDRSTVEAALADFGEIRARQVDKHGNGYRQYQIRAALRNIPGRLPVPARATDVREHLKTAILERLPRAVFMDHTFELWSEREELHAAIDFTGRLSVSQIEMIDLECQSIDGDPRCLSGPVSSDVDQALYPALYGADLVINAQKYLDQMWETLKDSDRCEVAIMIVFKTASRTFYTVISRDRPVPVLDRILAGRAIF